MDESDSLESYIRGILFGYARRHITTDYVQYTQSAVAELMSLEQIPLHDPVLLTLPTDPLVTLRSLWKLEGLSAYQESLSTSQDALLLIKNTITMPKGRPRSERLLWLKDASHEINPDLYHIEPILTRRAVRESPILGKTGGKHQAREVDEIDTRSYQDLLNSTLIAFKLVSVRPVQEPDIRKERILDVTYRLNASEYTAVRDLLNSFSSMSRPHPLPLNANLDDYRRVYLPASFNFNHSRPTTPLPESPPLVPMFARMNRRSSDEKDVGKQNRSNPSYPRSAADLPKFITIDLLASDDNNLVESCHSLAEDNVLIVDGWQTYVTSSPSTLDSVDDEIDELIPPLSPDSSVSGVLDLVHDIENSKLDVIEIPRNRRIGGHLGIQEAQQTNDLGSFLLPRLRASHDIMQCPLQGLATSSAAEGKLEVEKELELLHLTIPASEAANSVYGQVSDSSHLLHETASSVTGEDAELRRLYQRSPQPTGQHLSADATLDPLAFIREEVLFECSNYHQETRQTNEPSLTLMSVPSLCTPAGNASLVRSYLEFLVKPRHDTSAAFTGIRDPTSALPFLKSVNGVAPLRVELSWVPFTRTNSVPSHVQITETDTLMEREDVGRGVETLLTSWSGDVGPNANLQFKGCGFDDEQRWRRMAPSDTNNAFSSETCKSDIVLTRAERAALRKRGSGQVESRPVETSMNASDAWLSREALYDCLVHREKRGNLDDTQARPSKRPRQDMVGSVIGILSCNDDQDASSPVSEAGGADSGGNSGYDETPASSLVDSKNLIREELHLNDGYDTDHDTKKDPTCVSPNQAASRHCTMTTAHVLDPGIMLSNNQLSKKQIPELGYDHNSWEDFEALPFSYDSQVGQVLSQTRETLCTRLAQRDLDQGCNEHDLVSRSTYIEGAHRQDPLACSHQDCFGVVSPDPCYAPKITNDMDCLDMPYEDPIILATDDPSLPRISDMDYANQSLGVENFAKLRAKSITLAPVNVSPSNPTPDIVDKNNTHAAQESNSDSYVASTPQELYDAQTVCLPYPWMMPTAAHRYMASLDVLQKQTLVRSLAAQECMVDLVERDSLDGADLIIDSFTAVILSPLLSLSADTKKVLSSLSEQTWRYKRVLIIFEAYPTSKSYARIPRSQQTRTLAGPRREPEINAYTPPIRKAITKFRRDVSIAQGCGKNDTTCDVWYAFANTVQEAAMYARLFGDEAEHADQTHGVLWGAREWLDLDMSEDEEDLATLRGMNRFSASIILCQMSLQKFLDTSREVRHSLFGPYIGFDTMEVLNTDIDERLQMMGRLS